MTDEPPLDEDRELEDDVEDVDEEMAEADAANGERIPPD
jgi:hypothetical protein